jgi:DNA topoisomerase VI subunit A
VKIQNFVEGTSFSCLKLNSESQKINKTPVSSKECTIGEVVVVETKFVLAKIVSIQPKSWFIQSK